MNHMLYILNMSRVYKQFRILLEPLNGKKTYTSGFDLHFYYIIIMCTSIQTMFVNHSDLDRHNYSFVLLLW